MTLFAGQIERNGNVGEVHSLDDTTLGLDDGQTRVWLIHTNDLDEIESELFGGSVAR